MNRIRMFRGLLVALAALMLSAAAQAQLFRAYLSASGSDANPCTLIAPCRLLPAALTAVASGGEIWMVDSANYNLATVSVDKSVSILAVPGAVGSVVAIGGPAITVSASGLSVALRNLVIVPFVGGAGTDGIYMTGASTLLIEKSLIANMATTFHGVHVVGTGKVKIASTIIRNTGGWAVLLQEGARGEISDSQMLANASGGVTSQTSTSATTIASVSDSTMSGGNAGAFAFTTSPGGISQAFVTRCTIDGMANAGLLSVSGVGSALVAASNNVVVNNDKGWSMIGAGAMIRTLGNNHITDNTNASVGVLTSTLPM